MEMYEQSNGHWNDRNENKTRAKIDSESLIDYIDCAECSPCANYIYCEYCEYYDSCDFIGILL